jgi:serine/threonine protein kinase/tetratricopeptide (TPR) repeat protein
MSDPPEAVEQLFYAALELTGTERQRFVEQKEDVSPTIRRRVIDLLESYARSSGFLEDTSSKNQPSPMSLVLSEAIPDDEMPGDTIGRYKLLERLGEGGWGVVWMAEQKEPVKRRVALKILKLGMDTREFVARFESERQALALMDHPNIARVFDGGATEKGRPFFVMELVRGIGFMEYCDQERLPTRERLLLFIKVCHAVQHAHQKGIIHRDLKPSNILVTEIDGEAVPKVIDFGVAKATDFSLTEKTCFTRFHAFLGTPAYTSPEQMSMSGVDVDTRSDVYSLGVLLYEIISGAPPFDPEELAGDSLDDIRKKICETDPVRPSSRFTALPEETRTRLARRRGLEPKRFSKLIRGDLDWIALKCLEKNRSDRYDTVMGLSRDVDRFLQKQPVQATPHSALYHFRKYAMRHRAGVALSLLAALSLFSSAVINAVMAVRAERAEAEQRRLKVAAQAEAIRATQIAEFLKTALGDVDLLMILGRDEAVLGELVEYLARRIDRELEAYPEVKNELIRVLADLRSKLDQYEGAPATRDPDKLFVHDREWASLITDAGKLEDREKWDGAESKLTRALDLQIQHYGLDHWDVAFTLRRMALLFLARKDFNQAEAAARQAFEIMTRYAGPDHESLLEFQVTLGEVLAAQGDHQSARRHLERARTIAVAAHGASHPEVGHIDQLMQAYEP